jgi:AbrB family looped-hinge helix DNA binding protein
LDAVIVNITKDGRITIPKKIREKYGITDKALFIGEEKGIRIKPLPSSEP